MISRSRPTNPIRPGTQPPVGLPSNHTSTDHLLDTLHRLTEAGDADSIKAWLQSHPKAFATGPCGSWHITPDSGLDLQALFQQLGPDVSLPAIRLEGFEWDRQTICPALLCHPGLRDLTLHECSLGNDAWAAVADWGHQAFAVRPSALQRLAFTFEPPDRSALQVDDVVSSESMAGWTAQLRALKDLTLSGFQGGENPCHHSYRHVFAALEHQPLERLSLRGFLPHAFVSSDIHAALPRLSPRGGAPFTLSLQDWIWPTDEEELDGTLSAEISDTAEQTEETLQAWLPQASTHLTLDLQCMSGARHLNTVLGHVVAQRTDPVSLRLDCPEDAARQPQMPEHGNLTVLQALSDTATGLEQSALVGLHVQLIDAEPLPVALEPLLGVALGLTTMTVALRHTGPANSYNVRRTDRELSSALENLPSLTSLDIRSDYELVCLHDLKARVETEHHAHV